MPHKKLIALDFDGVLHAYTTPWTDAATISDGPTPGAMEFLRSLVEDDRFEVVVVSSRCKEPSGVRAIRDWLAIYFKSAGTDDVAGTEEKIVASVMLGRLLEKIQIVSYRPPAFLTIDDRALTFEGTWPDLGTVAAFRPWNKRPAAGGKDDVLRLPGLVEALVEIAVTGNVAERGEVLQHGQGVVLHVPLLVSRGQVGPTPVTIMTSTVYEHLWRDGAVPQAAVLPWLRAWVDGYLSGMRRSGYDAAGRESAGRAA